jgi:integrase
MYLEDNPYVITGMLTGCRLSEIMTLKWVYVDIKARELRLPDSKTFHSERRSGERKGANAVVSASAACAPKNWRRPGPGAGPQPCHPTATHRNELVPRMDPASHQLACPLHM